MTSEPIFSFQFDGTDRQFIFEATIELNEFREPIAAEVFGVASLIGCEMAARAPLFLRDSAWKSSYDPDVDSFTFSFGDGSRSSGQVNGILKIGLSGDSISAIQLFAK